MSGTAEAHAPILSRYRRGYSVPWNRPTYGYTVTCECGEYEARVNGTKREAMAAWRDHVRHHPAGAVS